MASPAPCKFFASGYCMRGEDCRYSHEKTTIIPQVSISAKKPSEVATSHSTQDPRSQIPCYHHSRGNCRNGSACPYSHTAEKQKEKAAEADLDPEGKQNYDNFTRDFGGALAKFDVGAQVSKISLPTDFSAARIDGLPLDVTAESFVSLLRKKGVHLMPECVRIRRYDDTASADVKVDDPTFAKGFCSKLNEKTFLKTKYPNMKASHVSAGLQSGTNSHQIECKKIQCSWFKPSRTVWLHFRSENVAEKVSERINSKSFKVLGQTIRSQPPTGRMASLLGPLTWTVMLPNLPAMTTQKDIPTYITLPHHIPQRIEIGEVNYDVEGEEASAIVMSLLLGVGPIEWSQISTELEGKRAKAVARYYEESDARAAVTSLQDMPLPFCKALTLTVQLISTAKFKVASSIFNAIQSRIRTVSQIWNEQHLKFKIYPSAGLKQQYRVLKIEGEASKDVAAAKEALNGILDGITVMDGDKPLWTSSLMGNGTVFQKFKRIQQDHGVIILRNKRKQEIKLYGPEENCKEVESIITTIIGNASYTAHIIELKPEDFRWACNGGFRMIATALGDNIATFDIVSRPRRILIAGTEKEYETALKMIGKKESKPQSESVTAKEDCVVCWGTADNPILTKCNHVYCIECFELSCSAASSNGKTFSINCHGDMGRCQVSFSLEELQEILSSKAFEDILEASFSSHIQRNPQTFRYCPKPNCDTIYRVTDTMHFNTCTECCTVICTYCHHQHDNKTCAEYEYESSGKYEATLKMMEKIGIKSCPKCKTSIEKTDGCNHIECKCGAHLCWVCLESFEYSKLCYDHMSAKHGGCFSLPFLQE
ncbi:uncharacterized protein EAE97_011578 [Botrytis byssoidea]|uniref:RING-type E3 ubiquitin transferase n=1 Tax=Botrytis byssoidea TaxID=139641 RepID=A0A9P5HV45_9HELO|nr:uncharacterized protein EAE97_011578 [Botrytis byssoidea]KAF7920237.1 hypothetical protein EAE97_011578 [Botrytis byssoidea]